MMKGFFSSRELAAKAPVSIFPRCGQCGLLKGCTSPNMPPTGKGKRGVLIVAEAPGSQEDEEGIQLIGKAGQLLRDVLDEIDVDLDEDCWKTNALTCRPPNNNTPTDIQIAACRPHLLRAVKKYKPRVIILLGGSAVKSYIGQHWPKIGAAGRWVGWKIPFHKPNVWVCPTYHPSYLLRTKSEVMRLWFKEHLKAAFDLHKRPWENPPNYEKKVTIIKDPNRAARWIRQLIKRGRRGMAAIDYETNMLKPDSPNAQIVSCSIAYGIIQTEKCIAYPWHGKAIAATHEFLRCPIPKIASNFKFEERWTIATSGHGVKNWGWDTMLAAHVIDNRPDITGLKFQSFIRLGMPSYDDHIKPYLRGGINTPNRIHELDLDELLIYNGLDSVLELELAFPQMRDLNTCPELPTRNGCPTSAC